jgi:hypothetical protein
MLKINTRPSRFIVHAATKRGSMTHRASLAIDAEPAGDP